MNEEEPGNTPAFGNSSGALGPPSGSSYSAAPSNSQQNSLLYLVNLRSRILENIRKVAHPGQGATENL